MSIQNDLPIFDIEEGCKYLVERRGKIGDVWRMCNQWNTQNYAVLPDDAVKVIKRIGTPEEIFN